MPDQTVAAVIALLAEKYPQTFFVYERKRVPLKVGITEDLEQQLAGAVTPQELHRAIACYVANESYLKRCRKAGKPRFNLRGEPEGEITEEQANYARLFLADPKMKTAHRPETMSRDDD